MKEYKNDPIFEAWRNALHLASEVERAMMPIRTSPPGNTVEDHKAFTYTGILWLQEQGLIGIEAEDESKIYYRLLPDITQDKFDYCVTYWADQAERLDVLRREGRALRVKALLADFDINSLPIPDANADATDWEIYFTRLKVEILVAESRKEVDTFANISQSQGKAPSSAPADNSKGGGCAVLCFLAMLVFAIFLAYACFVR